MNFQFPVLNFVPVNRHSSVSCITFNALPPLLAELSLSKALRLSRITPLCPWQCRHGRRRTASNSSSPSNETSSPGVLQRSLKKKLPRSCPRHWQPIFRDGPETAPRDGAPGPSSIRELHVRHWPPSGLGVARSSLSVMFAVHAPRHSR